MKQGFIQLHRQLLDSPCSTDPVYLSIWVYLLLQANHKPKEIILQGEVFTVARGSFIGSLKKISEHFNISLSKVKRVVDLLEKQQQVKTKRTSKYTYFTITNYDKFQSSETQIESNKKANRKQIETTNNDKNEDNEIISIYTDVLGKTVLSINADRKKLIDRFLKKHTVEQWREGMNKVKQSNYLQRTWTNWGLDWLLNVTNFTKLLEGNYDNNGSENGTKQNTRQYSKPSQSEQIAAGIERLNAEFGGNIQA